MTTRTLDTRASSWSSRIIGFLVATVSVLGLVAVIGVVAALAGTGAYYEMNRTKSGELDEMIKTELPIGVAGTHVLSVLDAEGIQHGPIEASRADDLQLLEAGIPAGTTMISAVAVNKGHSVSFGGASMNLVLDQVNVEMRFVLDDAGNLKDYLIYEEHTYPRWVSFNSDASKN
ncbi:MAG TPA: hypothetical protein VFO59_05725 [Dehalococcoidia bacterium]|nr:hypothetical protein [Dehalococcoidia bacterium]